jgi:hypothetical protein
MIHKGSHWLSLGECTVAKVDQKQAQAEDRLGEKLAARGLMMARVKA